MALELWFASGNKNKFSEIKSLSEGMSVELHGAHEIPHYSTPRETGSTFLENARIKARYLRAMKPENCWILAEDSGLQVEVLKNLPGVHSARYAGPTARDIENTLKLLKQISMQSTGDNRVAQYVCMMVLLSPTGEEKTFEGTLKGTISKDMRGKNGFGYDPVFVPDGETKTIAELGMATKNKLSHRAKAFREAKEFLKSQVL